ncbi:MAG: hypothetical protein ACXAB7_04715 [Candidatus Kariarchaeaceae archaeon]
MDRNEDPCLANFEILLSKRTLQGIKDCIPKKPTYTELGRMEGISLFIQGLFISSFLDVQPTDIQTPCNPNFRQIIFRFPRDQAVAILKQLGHHSFEFAIKHYLFDSYKMIQEHENEGI